MQKQIDHKKTLNKKQMNRVQNIRIKAQNIRIKAWRYKAAECLKISKRSTCDSYLFVVS